MAQTSKDFTDNNSKYVQVLFQRGKVVGDGELREIGRLERVASYRRQSATTKSTYTSSTPRHSVPAIKNLQVLGYTAPVTGANQILMKVNGEAIVNAGGYVFTITSDFVLDVLPNNSGGPTYQQLYFTVAESEVSSAADPGILINPRIGETARRMKLVVTWKVGTPNVDMAAAENTTEDPWDGGVRSFLVADIKRLNGGSANVSINEIAPLYKNTDEDEMFSMRMFNSAVRLGAPPYLLEDNAEAWYESGFLHIRNLSILIGSNSLTSAGGGYLAAKITEGAYPLSVGQSLVLFVPTDITGTSSEYNVVSATAPTSGQLRVDVFTAEQLSNGIPSGVPHAPMNRYRYIVLATYVQGVAESTIDTNIVFCDGTRITRERLSRPTNIPTANKVFWGHGNNWVDTVAMPAAYGPTYDTDITPYERTFLSPRERGLKLIREDILRTTNGSAYSGDIIWKRSYTARKFAIDLEGSELLVSGEVTTLNARWVPNYAGVDPDDGRWVADVVSLPSSIHYFVLQDGETLAPTAPRMIDGRATRLFNSATVWTAQGWNNGSGNTSGLHTYFDQAGNIRNTHASAGTAGIYDWRKVHYAEDNQPLRSSSITPSVPVNEHYAATRPLSFGILRTDGSGEVRLDDGALNLTNPTVVVDGDEAYIQVEIPVYTNTGVIPLTNILYTHGESSNVPSFAQFNWTATVALDTTTPGALRLRIYVAAPDAVLGVDVKRIPSIRKFQMSLVVFGGWVTPGPVFSGGF